MRRFAFGLGLLILGVLLSGCGLFGAPSPTLGMNPTLSGTVQRWTGTSGTIHAVDMTGDIVYGEGSIDARGRFSLQLDIPGSLQPLQTSEGTCSLKANQENIRYAVSPFLAGPGDEMIVYVDRVDNPSRQAMLFFVNKDARVWNEGNCDQKVDLNLRAGWNWVVADSKASTYRTAFPAGFVWVVSQ